MTSSLRIEQLEFDATGARMRFDAYYRGTSPLPVHVELQRIGGIP
jgi:hypothetical protein